MKIFLSYSHKDNLYASEITKKLENKDINVWKDIEQTVPGDLIESKISCALDECDAYCILISTNSMSSLWVRAELSSALSRWSYDPAFKFIPVLLEQESLPALLNGMLYINGYNTTPQEVSEKIIFLLSDIPTAIEINGIDWEPLLTAIENDQFTDHPHSNRFGGWSKSYAINYLPIAFPDQQKPDSISTVDSITVTHWFIRGLLSLRRVVIKTSNNVKILSKIEKLLAIARNYLIKHFDGQGAGLIRITAEGEQIRKDIRHSATFAKALLQLGHESHKVIKSAIEYSLSHMNEGDGRASTFSELFHLVGLIERCPDICPNIFTKSDICNFRNYLETSLQKMINPLEGENVNGKIFVQNNQEHMSAYYSWWVLDACGELLLKSENDILHNSVIEVLIGLRSLLRETNDGYWGFPLTLYGTPDFGATSHIGEVILRLRPTLIINEIDKVLHFNIQMISQDRIEDYIHHELLWSIPHFIERFINIKEQQITVD